MDGSIPAAPNIRLSAIHAGEIKTIQTFMDWCVNSHVLVPTSDDVLRSFGIDPEALRAEQTARREWQDRMVEEHRAVFARHGAAQTSVPDQQGRTWVETHEPEPVEPVSDEQAWESLVPASAEPPAPASRFAPPSAPPSTKAAPPAFGTPLPRTTSKGKKAKTPAPVQVGLV